MNNLPSVNPEQLGRRLSEARKGRGLTQQEVADYLQCSRPVLIAIEKGIRTVKSDEIVKLASFYGRTVHELVRPGEPVADLQPHLRAVASKSGSENHELNESIVQLQQFAENYCELERLMIAPMRSRYPPEIRLTDHLDAISQAEDVAISERNRLGLGDQPAHNLREILESDVGLRIMHGGLPSNIAGMYAYAGDLGCCIMINRKHPAARRRATLIHEYGHVIVDRYKPGIDYLARPGRKPVNERFAESFGMSFLMPATSVRRRFNEIVSTTNDFHVADLCRLSHLYFVSVEAMTYRLEGLRLIPDGTMRHLRESQFKVNKAKDMIELPTQPETKGSYSDRYNYLCVLAFEQAKISEGQLASFLNVDRVTAREMVEQIGQRPRVSDDGTVKDVCFDFQQSLMG
jgi:Zn-dependent peptidase ImmA (M78 family)/DNA-binding XRE family transcriptional regulator